MLFLALASPSSATRLGVGCHCADTVDVDLVCKVQGCVEEVTNLLTDGTNTYYVCGLTFFSLARFGC